MEYNLDMLKSDIIAEKNFLSKIISEDAMEEFDFDFSVIVAKIENTMPLLDEEKVKLLYIYNRYHGTLEFVTGDMVEYELHKEML